MKYQVEIPPPKAKRLINRKIIIAQSSGWQALPDKIVYLDNEQNSFEFELPDDHEWVRTAKWIDGWIFTVSVEYSNDTGFRKEKLELTPKVVG